MRERLNHSFVFLSIFVFFGQVFLALPPVDFVDVLSYAAEARSTVNVVGFLANEEFLRLMEQLFGVIGVLLTLVALLLLGAHHSNGPVPKLVFFNWLLLISVHYLEHLFLINGLVKAHGVDVDVETTVK